MRARMALRTALGRVDHDQRLSTVDHLDELRTRLFVALAVLGVAFAVCLWQNHRLLRFINAPLARQTQAQVRAGRGSLGAAYSVQRSARDTAIQLRTVAGVLAGEDRSSATQRALRGAELSLTRDVRRLSAAPQADKPVTLGIAEPFATTITVTLIFALIVSLPLLLQQAYGFLAPALDSRQRRRVLPLTVAAPGLFVLGVAFGYSVVLPSAIHFLQNFNSSEFNVLVQASQYYKFAATILLAMGLLFQIPLAVLAATRAGLITPRQLRRNRRYAVAACAAIAAVLPGDVMTMLLETVPPYLLFELGVLVATVADRHQRRAELRAAAAA